MVSIPAGFSDALRPHYGVIKEHRIIEFQSLLGFLMRRDIELNGNVLLNDTVSIPAGFSDALRLGCLTLSDPSTTMFQSLLGFLMRCDVIMPPDMFRCYRFNPCWVF